MSVLIFLIVLYLLLGFSLYKVFEKAGIPGWKALVPGLRGIEWCKIIGRKPSYAAWLLFPVVNIFIYAAMCIDLVRSFGWHSFGEAALSVIYAPISFFRIGAYKNVVYQGPILHKEREFHRQYTAVQEKKDASGLRKLETEYSYLRKSQLREWTEAIIFAVFAAAFIRMFLIEAYVIPTPSMEGSLKVGDYLFVSKAHYGIRTPMTVIQFPLIHNRFSQSTERRGIGKLFSFLDRESYLKNPSLPYNRLPALESIDRNEPVVFNWPAGDSVIIAPDRTYDIYQLRSRGIPTPPGSTIITRPVDKKDHYIKRCIGMPGDSLQIRNAVVYINGQPVPTPQHRQYLYKVTPQVNLKKLEEWGVSVTGSDQRNAAGGYFHLDDAQVAKIKGLGPNVQVERYTHQAEPGAMFPNVPRISGGWTVDDYGPIYIPKKGATTPLDQDNLPYYRRIIKDFEHNELAVRDGKIFINGRESSSYTFKQNYYWMMGDNRHNSEDSRVWGYVPEDHVVGKPLFIWFSVQNGKINWSRIFKSANAM
jgi:signal peptidase I